MFLSHAVATGIEKEVFISYTTTYCFGVLVLFLCIIVPACTTVQQQTEEQAEEQHSESTGERIVFLHFVLRSDTLAHRDSIELTDVMITKGRLKQHAVLVEHPPAPDHLLLTAVDKQQHPLQQVIVEHPLHRTVEYLGDDKIFHTARLNVTEATFFVRLHYNPSMTILRVEESTHGDTLRFIGDISLHHIHNNR